MFIDNKLYYEYIFLYNIFLNNDLYETLAYREQNFIKWLLTGFRIKSIWFNIIIFSLYYNVRNRKR